MERPSPAEMQTERTAAALASTTSAAVAVTTAGGGAAATTTSCTQTPSASISILHPSDRQAVQAIQQAMHRPQSMAAQYLHQMYAAQQQHLMLQTLQQNQHHHSPQLQSVAAIQQASVCQRQPSPSSSGSLVQPTGVSSNSITLPTSPVTAQLIGRTQTSNSAAAAATVSQQAMLLGNRPVNCNQAQMYLRTQMLILTPAAPVTAVQSDLPALSSCSSAPPSSQVQNLALRAHLPRALTTAHGVILKPTVQTPIPFPPASVSKASVGALKASPKTETQSEAAQSGTQTLTTAPPTVQRHALAKPQLTGPSGQQVAHHQLILQQTSSGSVNHRQLQPIALRVAPQETNPCPLPLSLSVKRLTAPTSSDPRVPASSSPSVSSSSSPSVTSSAQTSIPAAAVQPQPPPLVAAPHRRTSFPPAHNHPPPPPPPLVLPRLPPNPAASVHRLSLHSVQALAVQSGQVMLTEQELPVAEALLQMPYQNLPPPQTVAVDLKVHVVGRRETPPVTVLQSELLGKVSREGTKVDCSSSVKSSSPSRESAKQNGPAGAGSTPVASSLSVIRSPQPEKPSQLSSINPPPPSPPALPSPILPTAVRSPGQVPPAPASLPGSPDGIRTSHVLTHLIEGFVIREGVEPFSVGPSSLSEQQASLPDSREIHTNGLTAAEDSPADADHSDSTDSEMENDVAAVDAAAAGAVAAAAAALLQCEYCGSRGYAQTFLRSKRFCSMTCVRRFNVSCTKRISAVRGGRWDHRPPGRRGRPPSRINGASREHFLRRAHVSRPAEETRQRSPTREEEEEAQEEEEEEEEPPVPMKTRLQKQTERLREREDERRRPEAAPRCDGEEDAGRPSQWNVEQVFSYIRSLPGGRGVAEEFRSQEIDGQALLLLTEDHLVSAMNLKLGPALKLCAHIQALKEA